MRIRIILLLLASVLFCQSGCQDTEQKGELFTVDFQQEKELKYELISERQVSIDLDPTGKYTKGSRKGSAQKTTERMKLVISYKALEVDPYGFSVIRGTCESANVERTSLSKTKDAKKDAVEFLKGKTFTLKITPSGEIEDYSNLDDLIKELGNKAFTESKRGRIKNPDMIMDFVALQWFLWDTVSSIPKPLKGIDIGGSWESRTLVPMPVPSRVGRDVVYRLKEIQELEGKRLAVIKSEFTLADSAPENLPVPYTGSMKMQGLFGFLTGYKTISLSGSGEQFFNIDEGVLESDIQNYEAKVKASMMFSLGSDDLEPNMDVEQTFKIKLISAE